MNRFIVVDAMHERVCQRKGEALVWDTAQEAQDYIDYLHDVYGHGGECYEVRNEADGSRVDDLFGHHAACDCYTCRGLSDEVTEVDDTGRFLLGVAPERRSGLDTGYTGPERRGRCAHGGPSELCPACSSVS